MSDHKNPVRFVTAAELHTSVLTRIEDLRAELSEAEWTEAVVRAGLSNPDATRGMTLECGSIEYRVIGGY